MNLSEIQVAFSSYVLELKPGILPSIRDSVSAPANQRAEIYAEAYRMRLVDVLSEYFPGLRSLLGVEDFEEMAVAFIDKHPSRYFSVRWFGEGLNGFLNESASFNSRPALAEMAAFEWELAAAFDAADTPPLDREHLAAVPATQWPCLRLYFHPSVRRLDLHTNVAPIWTALTTGANPPDEQTGPPASWIIWRPRLNPQFRSLLHHEAEVLDAAIAGRTFAKVCELLTHFFPRPDVPAEAAALINKWIADRMIVAFNIESCQPGAEFEYG